MNKRVLYFLFVVVVSLNMSHIYGQDTFYYKLTKKIQGDVSYTNTAGGQFITFYGNKCYDSDIYGISVGNGELNYESDYSAANTKTYSGSSYFGNVLYRFKSDLSVLNVIVNDNLIYVYKRQEAPSSITTCSLIRKKSNDGANSFDYTSPSSGNTGFGETYNPTKTDETSHSNPNSNHVKQATKHTCSLCRGQKRIEYNTYPTMLGTKDYKVRCNECGGYFLRSTGHTHIQCPQCHGKGYFTTD